MKSELPFRGVPAPAVARLSREVVAAHPLPDRAAWEAAVRELWDLAAYREERYAATHLTGHRLYAAFQDPAALPLYEHLVVTGAWWDHVDDVAIHRVGPILRSHPVQTAPVVLAWTRSPDRWLRRASVVCQIGAKERTDTRLLTQAIEANAADPDFFLRKGIGWALREWSRTDPGWVTRFLAEHADGPLALSPLSVREASRYVGRPAAQGAAPS